MHGRGGFPMSVHTFTRHRRHETRNANASEVLPSPAASGRPARRKVDRKVKTAARDFINAILNVSAGLVVADEYAALLSARIGRYQAPTFIASFDPPPDRGPGNLFPRGDRSGRVVVVWQDERGAPHKWFYERRSRALARSQRRSAKPSLRLSKPIQGPPRRPCTTFARPSPSPYEA
jgi:hypothetical protein